MKYAAALLLGLVFAVFAPAPASAQETVECVSHNYEYAECRAPLDAPQLIYQDSSSPCIVNRTWGFNRRTGYIWVSQGCSGVFDDAAEQADQGYDGCHGAGCLVDNPDRPPRRADLYLDGIDRCSSAAVAKARSMGHNPRVGRIIDKYPDRDGYHVEGEVSLTRSDGDFSMHFLCVWDGNRATVLLGSGL